MTEKITEQMDKMQIFTPVLVFVAMGLFIAYILLIQSTVINVVAREEAEKQSNELAWKISELEFEYIALKNEITDDFAFEQGFQEAKHVAFTQGTKLVQNTSVIDNR